jgi:hypothetical protein
VETKGLPQNNTFPLRAGILTAGEALIQSDLQPASNEAGGQKTRRKSEFCFAATRN